MAIRAMGPSRTMRDWIGCRQCGAAELLAPAGGLDQMLAAIAAGTDAIYAGLAALTPV